MLPVFFILCFLCLVRCLLSFFYRSSFLRVVVWKNFRERTFVFVRRCLFGVFWCCFAYVFASLLVFCSRHCLKKILLLSGLVFFGCCLSSFGCFADVAALFSFFFFLRETAQVVTGHTPTRTLCSFSFFLSVSPAAFVCSPVLAVRPFLLVFCRGAILGPGRFLDSLGTSLRPFSWTRGGKGVSLLLVLVLFFPFSFCFAAFFTRSRRGGPVIERGVPPGHRACPSPE